MQVTGYRIQDSVTGYRPHDASYIIQDTGFRSQDTGHMIQVT